MANCVINVPRWAAPPSAVNTPPLVMSWDDLRQGQDDHDDGEKGVHFHLCSEGQPCKEGRGHSASSAPSSSSPFLFFCPLSPLPPPCLPSPRISPALPRLANGNRIITSPELCFFFFFDFSISFLWPTRYGTHHKIFSDTWTFYDFSQIILELKIKFKIKRWQHRCQDPSPSRPPPHALWGEHPHHNHLIFMTNVINLLVFCLKIQLFAFFIGHPPNPLWPGVRNKSQWTKSQIMMNLFCPTHHRKIFCEVTSSPFYEVPIYLFPSIFWAKKMILKGVAGSLKKNRGMK